MIEMMKRRSVANWAVIVLLTFNWAVIVLVTSVGFATFIAPKVTEIAPAPYPAGLWYDAESGCMRFAPNSD